MKRFVILAVLVGFAGWTFSGLFPMSMHNHSLSVDSVCQFAYVNSVDCPENAIAMSLHHYTVFQSLLSSFVYASVFQFAVVVLWAISLYLIQASVVSKYSLLLLNAFRRRLRTLNLFLHEPQQIIRWLSLFINSPAFK